MAADGADVAILYFQDGSGANDASGESGVRPCHALLLTDDRIEFEIPVGSGAVTINWSPQLFDLVLVSINRWCHDDSVAAGGAPSGKTHGQEHVLVIKDDDGVRRFIVDCLQSLGYTVSEASGGLEGLAQIRTETPELLIVDYPMPGLNGVDVINQSRAAAPDLPIILATGYADMDAVHRVVDPSQVLRKPFQIGELEVAVRRALGPSSQSQLGASRIARGFAYETLRRAISTVYADKAPQAVRPDLV